MAVVLAITLAMFLLADPLERVIGERVTKVITRLLGIILGALAVQFVISGIAGIPFVAAG
jgi:multiple antibiotic resistance protein